MKFLGLNITIGLIVVALIFFFVGKKWGGKVSLPMAGA